jgi:hypothetical protein
MQYKGKGQRRRKAIKDFMEQKCSIVECIFLHEVALDLPVPGFGAEDVLLTIVHLSSKSHSENQKRREGHMLVGAWLRGLMWCLSPWRSRNDHTTIRRSDVVWYSLEGSKQS